MNSWYRQKQFPAGNPLANALVVIVGVLTIGLSIVLGVVALIALGGIFLVMASIIGIRLWWHQRKLRGARPQHRGTDADPGIIEGEYRVVSRHARGDSKSEG